MSHNYWDIRKRKQLKHLPAPDPETVRAGVNDSDTRFLQSRRWMEMYHEAKKEPPDVKISQEDPRDRLMADADASSRRGDERDGSEEAAGAGGEFAPR